MKYKKSTPLEYFFCVANYKSNDVFIFKIDESFGLLSFEIHGNRRPHFMNFHYFCDVKSGKVLSQDIDSSEIPAHVVKSS